MRWVNELMGGLDDEMDEYSYMDNYISYMGMYYIYIYSSLAMEHEF